MAVLSRAAAVAVACAAGCYDPTLRDCTVACSAIGDCASGQSCQSGWCVATASETTCAPGTDRVDSGVVGVDGNPGIDGGKHDKDAGPPGSDAGMDAKGSADLVPLHVQVMGPGLVTLDATVTCMNDCMYLVASGAHELTATAADGHSFQMWSGACSGSAETCTVTLSAPRDAGNVGARFAGGPP